MGLLKGVGRELKGLFRDGGLADTFDEARAYLDGDYGTAMRLSERDAARLRARRAQRRAGRSPRASLDRPYEGMMWDDPEMGRMVLRNGEWEPW